MTREEVIKGLEQFIADFKPFCGNKSDWQRVDDAIALLKAHEPVEPKKDDEGEWFCGSCGEGMVGCDVFDEAGIKSIRNVYCPTCGRAVRWT